MNDKNPFIDFLKGNAILLVLIGHCVQYGSGAVFLSNELYWDNGIMKTIYSFHMPLFIAISGYLFWHSVSRHGMTKAIKSRITRLVPVCFIWAVILCVVDMISGESIGISKFILCFLTDFWFLWAIIFCVCCVAVIEWADKFTGGGYAGNQHNYDWIYNHPGYSVGSCV